eukprot:TRINITY_DN65875_c0_g1_i1.p2 TRINITY_DN65875_c0_g1~~TRINITY_DN65875_c0_g1_i1.p2  ORF type:complete len:162 (-),score=38.32 TRINITY_DN65875_c0_g1_i1:77-562(-)
MQKMRRRTLNLTVACAFALLRLAWLPTFAGQQFLPQSLPVSRAQAASRVTLFAAPNEQQQEAVNPGLLVGGVLIAFVVFTFVRLGVVDCFEEKRLYWEQTPDKYVPQCTQLVSQGIFVNWVQDFGRFACNLNKDACKEAAKDDFGIRFLAGSALKYKDLAN